jgi:hypothetical protein
VRRVWNRGSAPCRSKDKFLHKNDQTVYGGPIQPLIQMLMDTKQPGLQADYSLPITAECKYARSCLFTVHVYHGVQKDFALPTNNGTLTLES